MADVTSPGRGIARVLRGTLLALCCTLLALAGHVVAGGEATAVLPMLVAAAPLAAGFTVWADRRRDTAEIIAAALGSQLTFHVLLSLRGPTAAAHDHRVGQAMLLGHVVAAALTGWALASGEGAVWAVYHAMRQLVSVMLVRLAVTSDGLSGRCPGHATPPGCGTGIVLAAAHRRRGPPRVGLVRLAAAR